MPYSPGRLEAIGYRGGREVSRTSVETVGQTVALKLVADRRGMLGTGSDVQPVTVMAVDARGRIVPDAIAPVSFRVTKTDFAGAPLVVPFPAGAGERKVVLVVEAEPGKASGLGRTISVRERPRFKPSE